MPPDAVEVWPQGEAFQNYGAKRRSVAQKHKLHPNFSPFIYQNIQTLDPEAHRLLGCHGVSRVDLRFEGKGDGTGQIVGPETNM